ncbi:MAG: tetratricopeptide repeat protein [Candidatus Obscuribacterales bacterium]|nr:tetratricopeptide repeat protein [Candidatus Obscuribacterales bacterium]
MKKATIVLSLLLLNSFSAASFAKFAAVEVVNVPISRILNNLQSRVSSTGNATDKARLEFQIGRLHSMAYARRTELAPTAKRDSSTEESASLQPWYGHTFSDYKQFYVEQGQKPEKIDLAKKHLAEAIKHLRAACTLDPKMDAAKLGLAWCLQQSGDNKSALPLYREIFKTAYEKEKNNSDGFRGTSITAETAGYMEQILDPKADAAELADLAAKKKEVGTGFRKVTPIVVPLRADVAAEDLMASHRVVFDLDGNGPRAYGAWPTSSAGWLVFDGDDSGRIESGLKLFGCSTFWIFWKDGYEALSALDSDNDGFVRGAEAQDLKIWSDSNQNGISEAGEVRTLAECSIEALSCRASQAPNGMLHSERGVVFTSGATGTTYDWLVNQVP